MKLTTLTTIILSSILLFSGCKAKGHQEQFSKGVFENGEYINKFLGFKMDIPDSWYVYNEEELKQASNDIQNGDHLSEGGKELVKKGKIRSAELLLAQVYNPHTFEAIVNPTLMVIVERVDDIQFIRSAEDYMKFLRQNSQGLLKEPLDFTEMARVELNGNRFDRHTVENEQFGYKFKRTQFCEIMNGYAVLFTLTYADDIDRKKLVKCLSSLEYK